MHARNSSLLFNVHNQVDGEFSIAGVNGAYNTGEFVYTDSEITSHWQVNLDGFMLYGAAVNATPRLSPWVLVSLQIGF